MAEHLVVTTDAEINAALQRAKLHDLDPVAQTVTYLRDLRVLYIALSNGRRLFLPIEDLQGLEGASDEQLANCKVEGLGTGINFPDLDADFHVPALIGGVYGTRRWMSKIGAKGGAVSSEAKKQAARANGAKGGRPKKEVLVWSVPGFDQHSECEAERLQNQ